MRAETYEKVNGFSNNMWGWGREDDDLYGRIRENGFDVDRPKVRPPTLTMFLLWFYKHLVRRTSTPTRPRHSTTCTSMCAIKCTWENSGKKR